MGMQNIAFNIVRPIVEASNVVIDYTRLPEFPNFDRLRNLHSNLTTNRSIYNFYLILISPFVLIVGVNMSSIINVIVTLLDALDRFTNSLIQKCTSYYDPVKDVFFTKKKL